MGKQQNRIAVIKGGISAERDGCLEMGKNCALALRSLGHDVAEIDAVPGTLAQELIEAKPDVVFNALMGRWGEDGAVQGLLEWLNFPYTHSGVVASAIGMDKAASRAVYLAEGLPVPEGRVITRQDLQAGHPIDPPYVLKPISEGSSIGIEFVHTAATPIPEPAAEMGDSFLVEKLVPGLDLTVSVLGDSPFGITQIETVSGFWDYESKYAEVHPNYITAPSLPDNVRLACETLALKAHKAIGCRFISRTDMRWDITRGAAGLVVLETNTQPAIGFDSGTTIDQQLASRGVSLAELCQGLVADASLRR